MLLSEKRGLQNGVYGKCVKYMFIHKTRMCMQIHRKQSRRIHRKLAILVSLGEHGTSTQNWRGGQGYFSTICNSLIFNQENESCIPSIIF